MKKLEGEVHSKLEQFWYKPLQGFGYFFAFLLLPFSLLFASIVALKNWMYTLGIRKPKVVSGAFVVSVGNIHVGGAGKTPAVIFLANWMKACGHKVAVLSRGYGRNSREIFCVRAEEKSVPNAEAMGDEPRMIALRCPGVFVWVGPNKVELAKRACKAGANYLIVDDGFQTRGLHRDVDIVVLDEAVGFGNGHLLPCGPLREKKSSLCRASFLWLRKTYSTNRLGMSSPIEAEHYLSGLWNSHQHFPVEHLKQKQVFALSALARPSAFIQSLERLGANIVGNCFFKDHHPFSKEEISCVVKQAEKMQALLITTEKDFQRVASYPEFLPSIWVLTMDVKLLNGAPLLAKAMKLSVDKLPGPLPL
ncbi:MAG: tetraacyldisaccharide 4'-kinase [Cystobacterineae bacterium]|nr:tetraacyldisaccharide 4'-kinase [Cystobacterineae bacterium]